MECNYCGKKMPDQPCVDPENSKLEEYIATQLPIPAKAWCSSDCYEYENGTKLKH